MSGRGEEGLHSVDPGSLAQAGACFLMVDPEPLVRLRWPFAPAKFTRERFPQPSVDDMERGKALAELAIDLRLVRDPTEDGE